MKIKYKENSLFKHPETPKEAKELMKQMTHFNEIKDCDGVFLTAMQLIPDMVEDNNYEKT